MGKEKSATTDFLKKQFILLKSSHKTKLCSKHLSLTITIYIQWVEIIQRFVFLSFYIYINLCQMERNLIICGIRQKRNKRLSVNRVCFDKPFSAS